MKNDNKGKKNLDFLILYEHIVREYESLLLLKLELEKRGYTVEIRHLLARKRLKYCLWKKPEVLVSSCMYDNEAINSHVYNNVGVCNKVVNLHWEQMLSDTQENGAWFNMDGNAKKCTQICWGKKTAARLVYNGMKQKNCPVTGAIMMDFLTPQFNGYFKDKKQLCKEHNLDENKELMLYISSFGYASMTPQEVKELSLMAGEDFSGFAKTNAESMTTTLEWFDKYLTQNKNVQLVYRRHPSEWNSEELTNLSKKHSNFHVIFSDSVRQWIVASDKIFIWMSTAIAEVYFANKTCHILRPQPIEHEFDPVIYKNAQYVTSYKEFEKCTNEKNSPFPINNNEIELYFDKNDVPSYIRLANLLEDVYKNDAKENLFSYPLKKKFNLLKYIALVGIHAMFAIKLHPEKFKRICPAFASFAGRIYGYIEKAYISEQEINNMTKRIAKFL